MLPATLFSACLLTISTSVSAAALRERHSRDTRLTVSVPLNGLPSPSTISPAVKLKYITIALGTQNYTCASTPKSSTDAPATNGAKAVLYDAGAFLQRNPNYIGSLSDIAFDDPNTPSNFGFRVLGQHFFNPSLSPVFDLTSVQARLVAKKLNGVAAPPDACPGKDGNEEGAVDWLQLIDNGTNQTFGGVTYSYRVETAGGKAPDTCKDEDGSFEVPYAAEYWFYGP